MDILHTDNIIVGLLKNLIRKNKGHSYEGFMEYNKHFFRIKLDTSGFEETIILDALEELSSNQKWYGSITTERYLAADINNPQLQESHLATFNMRKDLLIQLRDNI